MTQPMVPTPMNMPGAQQAAAAAGGQPPATPAAADPAAAAANPPPATPAGPAPVSGAAPPPQQPPADPNQAPPPPAAPQWGSDAEFDPQRAWNLIQNVRGDNEALKQQVAAAEPILAEHERQRQASLSDNERLAEQLAGSNTATEAWRTRAVQSKVEAMAAARFVDTETTLALLGDCSRFTDGDEIDTAKISAALDTLATDKPFLVTQPGPQGFTPNPAQGQSGAGPAAALDAQIKAAQDRGDFTTSIALKQQQKLHQT